MIIIQKVLIENSLAKGFITEEVAKIFGKAVRNYGRKIDFKFTNEIVGIYKNDDKQYLGIFKDIPSGDKNFVGLLSLKRLYGGFTYKSEYTIIACSERFRREIGDIYHYNYEKTKLLKQKGRIVTTSEGLSFIESEMASDINNWQLVLNKSHYDGVDFYDRVMNRSDFRRLIATQYLPEAPNSYDVVVGKSYIMLKLDENKYILTNLVRENN